MLTFSYAAIEAALFAPYDEQGISRSAFRARLQNFQRLGFTPSKPGRGKVIEYSFHDVMNWALGIEFCQMGAKPSLVGEYVLEFRRQEVVQSNHRAEYLIFYPEVIFHGEMPLQMSLQDDPSPRCRETRFGVIAIGALARSLERELTDGISKRSPLAGGCVEAPVAS